MHKAALQREIRKGHRERAKARLLELRGLIAAARVKRREAVAAIKQDCAAKRIEARAQCQLRALRARDEGNAEIEKRKRAKTDETKFERDMQAIEKPRPLRSTAKERAGESDDEVRRNLDPSMVPVFDAVRKFIKRTPRMDRTEVFFQWAHENPEEVLQLQMHDSDRLLKDLLAEEAKHYREMKHAGAVPF